MCTLPFQYKIQLKVNAKLVVHPPRRVPASLCDHLKQELERMQHLGIISKITEPTDWVSSMVCVKKSNGDLRICIDPKDLKLNIRREHYPIPKHEEITSEMAIAKIFSKLDASRDFWQMQLDDTSTKLCTFNTTFGCYCFNRMPFGIISASEIFHRAMEQMTEGIDGVQVYDIIIWSSTGKGHNARLLQVLKSIYKFGLKLNRSKSNFGISTLTFMGNQISEHGVQPDNDKVLPFRRL
ncbi:uncharacterized protein K02A2.6-like [Scyliorhinus canicula]|uniref:uncharacterized protein K02A2.6-like n=1 Tax=Scyliorhinus canicula TaxID=7830 RepID=UPI0018F48A24|nr:uncharacterized protein K02A2.6-like [Scyliorhinus canicula]